MTDEPCRFTPERHTPLTDSERRALVEQVVEETVTEWRDVLDRLGREDDWGAGR